MAKTIRSNSPYRKKGRPRAVLFLPRADKFPFIGDLPIINVGAIIDRPPDFVAQNLIAARRLSVISFRNPNNCTAIVGRAANDRPYIV